MKTSVNIKMEEADRDNAKKLFETLGVDMTTAVNIFIKTVIREQGFPFPLSSVAFSDIEYDHFVKQWNQDLKLAEQQEKDGLLLDFSDSVSDLKRAYGLK